MGTIYKRGDKYQAQIRRAGLPLQSRSFRTQKLAEKWDCAIETEMDRGAFLDLSAMRSTTLADVLVHYRENVTVFRRKEQSRSNETCRINRLLKNEIELCSISMDRLRPHDIEDFRDRWRQQPSPHKKNVDSSPR